MFCKNIIFYLLLFLSVERLLASDHDSFKSVFEEDVEDADAVAAEAGEDNDSLKNFFDCGGDSEDTSDDEFEDSRDEGPENSDLLPSKYDDEIQESVTFTYMHSRGELAEVSHLWNNDIGAFCGNYPTIESFEWGIRSSGRDLTSFFCGISPKRLVTICFSFSKRNGRYFAHRFPPGSKDFFTFEVNLVQGDWVTDPLRLPEEWLDGSKAQVHFNIEERGFCSDLKKGLEAKLAPSKGMTNKVVQKVSNLACQGFEVENAADFLVVIKGGNFVIKGDWPIRAIHFSGTSTRANMVAILAEIKERHESTLLE